MYQDCECYTNLARLFTAGVVFLLRSAAYFDDILFHFVDLNV